MKTIDITEANEWRQTLIDVGQALQDKAAILGKLSEFDQKVYDDTIEMQKKLSQSKDGVKESAEEYIKNQWGEAWLRNQWDACDVIDSLQEYAEAYHKERLRSEIIKWMEDYIDLVDEYLKDK